MNDIFKESHYYFKKLHELRCERAVQYGLDLSLLPSFAEGGDYALSSLLFKYGLPDIQGQLEAELLMSGKNCRLFY